MAVDSAARRTPIPDRDGWYLTGVNRIQDDGRAITEVQLTWAPDDTAEQGDTRTFTMPGVHPRDVMLAAAIAQIDAWAQQV